MRQKKKLLDKLHRPDNAWYARDWRNYLEDHRLHLIKNSAIHVVETSVAYEHRGNLYGYLNALNLDERYHWAILRLNGMHDPVEFNEGVQQLIVPSTSLIDNLYNEFKTIYENEDTSY